MPPVEVEYTEHGRWGGRLTNRPLPDRDSEIDKLSAHDRDRLAKIWLTRAAMERRVADSFEVIHSALTRQRAATDLIELSYRAIDDEYRHAELSRVVASRFAGHELPPPERLVLETPKHTGASPDLRDTLFVVGQCVLNETTAGVYLETCLTHATGPLAVSALRELLSDEIDHGRIGWAHLASVSQDVRNDIARWMLPMAYLNLRIWKYETALDPNHTEALSKHGAPPAETIHDALANALASLIVPGLKQLGMSTASLEAWIEAGAGTDKPPVEFLGVS